MRYWGREIAGWVLVGLGLFAFLIVYDLCERRNIFGGGILAIFGIFIFRGGIHLLKVAVAARVCQQAQDRLYPAPPPPVERPAPGQRLPQRRTVNGGR